jgi:hypothetical protein
MFMWNPAFADFFSEATIYNSDLFHRFSSSLFLTRAVAVLAPDSYLSRLMTLLRQNNMQISVF